MQTKLFKILDRATEFVAVCTAMWPSDPFISDASEMSGAVAGMIKREASLLREAGFFDNSLILFAEANGGRCGYEPEDWGDRTFRTAHSYIADNWDTLTHGDTIDVEVILGEKDQDHIASDPDPKDPMAGKDYLFNG